MADKTSTMKTKLEIDGEKAYKDACAGINTSLKTLGTEMGLVTAQYADNARGSDALKAKQDVLKRTLEEQNKKVEEAQKALKQLKDAGFDATNDTVQKFQQNLNNAQAAVARTENQLQSINNELNQSKINWDAVGDAVTKGAQAFAVGIAAAGTAIVAGFGYAVSVADDVKGAMNDFEASTGIANAGAKGFEDAMISIYNGNYGENFEDIAASMSTVAQNAKNIDPTNIEELTTGAIALRDTFGYDIQEQMRAVNMLMDQFGLTGDEAFNLIAQGAQNGLDKNGDLLDTINEYSTHFKSLGLDAEDMFNSLANGAASGTFSVDKLGDAVKEFGIRVKDGTANEAFTKLGLSAEETAAAFGKGGDSAAAAFKSVTDELFALEDPLEQNTLGVQMFGTMWEDLGIDGVKALTDLQGEISTSVNALQDINAVKYDTVGEAFTGLGRILQTSFVLPIGEDALPLLNEFANTLSNAAREADGDMSVMADAFGGALSELMGGITQMLPQLATLASEIVLGLAQGIITSLPTITTAATQVIITLVDGIISMLPSILEGAVQIITGLAQGIAQALPQLLPKIVEVVAALVQTLIDNIPMLIDAALQLVLGLANGVIAAIPVLVEAIPKIITSLITALLDSIPLIIQAGIDLITSLVGALPEIILAIVEAIPQIIDGIITAVVDSIPLIIQAGIDLLIALIQALPQIITTIIGAIPQIVEGITTALIGNIDKIIMAGVQLFIALIQNLPTIIVEIVKAVPQIITGIVDAFGALMGQIVDIGGNLLKGIWEGISGAGAWLWEQVSGFFGGLVDNVKNFLGIHSPSTVFADVGGNMALGIGEGFDGSMDGVSGDMQSAIGGAGAITAQEAISAINNGIINNVGQLDQAVNAIVQKVLNALNAQNSKFVNQGIDIDKNIASGMVSGIPQITAKVPQIVTSIINAFIAQNQKFINQGIEFDKNIASGMVSGITQITVKIPQIVTSIINAFAAQSSKFTSQGVEFSKSLASGMVSGIPQITAKIPQMIAPVIKALGGYTKEFVAAGENMVKGIWQGFENLSGWLEKKVRAMMREIVRAVEDEMDINSPSKVFAGIGEYMAAGIGIGFQKEMRAVERSIRKAMPKEFEADATVKVRGASGRIPRAEDKPDKEAGGVSVVQNFYTEGNDYAKQQREAAKQFKLIARQI